VGGSSRRPKYWAHEAHAVLAADFSTVPATRDFAGLGKAGTESKWRRRDFFSPIDKACATNFREGEHGHIDEPATVFDALIGLLPMSSVAWVVG